MHWGLRARSKVTRRRRQVAIQVVKLSDLHSDLTKARRYHGECRACSVKRFGTRVSDLRGDFVDRPKRIGLVLQYSRLRTRPSNSHKLPARHIDAADHGCFRQVRATLGLQL